MHTKVSVRVRFTYEIAPVFTLIEDVVLTKMRQLIGWSDGDGDGIFAPGIRNTVVVEFQKKHTKMCSDIKSTKLDRL